MSPNVTPTDQKPFKPGFGLKNRHIQTLWAPLFRRRPNIDRWRERITLSDGDFVDLDWAGPTRGPIVMILHGLTGSSESKYAIGLQAKLQQQGIRSFVMHFRGCSDEPNLKPRIYHSGETEDAKEIFALMRTRYPRTPIFAAGFSLGGNVLLKWLGESETPPDLVAAVAVSVPYQLEVASDTMDNGFSKFYRNIMLKELKRLMLQKKKLFQRANEDHHSTYNELGNMKRHKTFRDFDHHVVAPLHGFESADDYYQRSSSRQYLKNIAVPTLLIHGKDDPLMTPEVVPNAEELSATTTLEAFEHGGHVGFVSGSLIKPRYWLEKRIPDFIQYHLKENNQRAAIKVSETA